MKKGGIRLDRLLVERGYAATRHQALGIILSGNVFVDGQRTDKAGRLFASNSEITIKNPMPYAGRGGLKLEGAIRGFNIDVAGKVAIDIGASTGGFTDCLLQHGAKKVYAVDVGYGQLHWKLRDDVRVVNLEKTHILRLDWTLIEDVIDVATVDVSFISLTNILPSLWQYLSPSAMVIALVKPQFEVGRGEVGRGGVVRDSEKIESAVTRVMQFAERLGFQIKGSIPSPISGQKGNMEYLLYMMR